MIIKQGLRVIATVFAGLTLAGAAIAQPAAAAPIRAEDFAWQWPLKVQPNQDLVTITLTPSIYSRLLRDDLRDLAAFNADGESLPFGPSLPVQPYSVQPATTSAAEIPLFRVPRSRPDETERLSLNVERDGTGRLRQLRAEIGDASEAPRVDDWLLDLSSLKASIRGLHIELEEAALGSLNARIQISASRDLDTWQVIAPSQTLLSLRRGEMNLERLSVEFSAAEWAYLRLRRLDEDSTLPLTRVTADVASPATLVDQRLALQLMGRAVVEQPGTFEYRLDGPYPIERIGVELADRNALAIVIVESRSTPSENWRERASGTAFRLGGNTGDIHAAPFELAQTRDRYWRIRSEPALTRAPTMNIGYRTEEFVLLAQGAQPYRVVAGSATALRPSYPLLAILPQLAAVTPSALDAKRVTLGNGELLAGDSALLPFRSPIPMRKWLLWGILIGGSVLIGWLALRLLRDGKQAQERSPK